MLLIIIFAASMLIAGVAQSCYDLPGCNDNWGCEADYWEAAPDCFIECTTRPKMWCQPDPL